MHQIKPLSGNMSCWFNWCFVLNNMVMYMYSWEAFVANDIDIEIDINN